jgi:hypothetical protein
MTQAQPQSATPPPLPDIVPSIEADEKADDSAAFFKQFDSTDAPPRQPEPPPPVPEAPPRVLAVRGAYVPAESNVFDLDSVRPNHGVWHRHAPSHYAGMEPRHGRPRHARRPKRTAVKKRYRTGQFIAALFALMGWLTAVAGLAALLVTFLEPELSLRLGLGSPNLIGSVGTLAGGLLTVALAVAARALFDLANDNREMLAMQQHRARFGAEPY